MQTYRFRPIVRLSSLNKCERNFTKLSTVSSSTEDLKSWKQIPGPPSVPLLGPLRNYFYRGNKVRLFQKYGPLVRFNGMLGIEPTILVADPEAAAYVLRSENSMPIRPGFRTLEHYRHEYTKNKTKQNTIGCTGLLTDHGEVWKGLRTTVNPVMLVPKTIKMYRNVLDEIADDMINRLKADRDENNMIRKELNSELNLLSLKSISIIALGYSLNCLDPSLPDDAPENELAHCIHDLLATIEPLEFKPNIWEHITTPQYLKAMKLFKRQDALIRHFLDKGIEQLKQNISLKPEQEKSVLGKLLEINEEYAYIMANEMLLVGVDTVAITLIAILYLLASNPETQNKLREEVLSKNGNQYMKACIKEGLRMLPPIPGTFRRTTQELNLMGYKIPKGLSITLCHRHMSLQDQNFPRAKEYIPERWIVEKNDPLYHGNAHPFASSPFGYGVRSCIGRRIAELEMEIFLTKVMENFKVEWFGPPPKLVRTSLVYIKGPYNFVFRDLN